jgi:ABC-type bacteriocin/lantibiotic exporter with double-glycine peptidase domain
LKDKSHSLFFLISRVWGLLSNRRHWQFYALFLLMVLSSFAEVLSIGAVLPFLAVLASPDSVKQVPGIYFLLEIFNTKDISDLLIPLGLFLAAIIALANALRLSVVWMNTRLSFAVGAELSVRAYRTILYQPYLYHVARNSGEEKSRLIQVNAAVYVIMMVMNILGGTVMLIAVMGAIISINTSLAIAAISGFGLIYALILLLTRRRLFDESQRVVAQSARLSKTMQEGFGGIRDILIDGTQEEYCKIYSIADSSLRRAEGNVNIISSTPRYLVETLGAMLILLMASLLADESNQLGGAIPLLGAFALAAQRLLPVMQNCYTSWVGIRSRHIPLEIAVELLSMGGGTTAHKGINTEEINLKSELVFRDVWLRYHDDSPWVLMGMNLSIPIGSRVGVIGKTGSGKSTLLDVVMGLLAPTRGAIFIDGVELTAANLRSWQSKIAHVPQSVYLADSTIEENIAFGVPRDQIDRNRVMAAAADAQISSTIEAWPLGYATHVGERGVKLSGGQRQRIGIARALYKNAKLIVFDEATSALDGETENAVMRVIDDLGSSVTVLIIAHRLTTLKNCDRIICISQGRIEKDGPYSEIISQSV